MSKRLTQNALIFTHHLIWYRAMEKKKYAKNTRGNKVIIAILNIVLIKYVSYLILLGAKYKKYANNTRVNKVVIEIFDIVLIKHFSYLTLSRTC